MKKEGTGTPKNPDIEFTASVKARELHFEEVPDPEVKFSGSTERNSVWRSERKNLPDEVRPNVTYRDPRIRLKIATELAEDPSVAPKRMQEE